MMKFLSNFILLIGMVFGSLWGGFIAIDTFIVSKAKGTAESVVAPVKIEMETNYKHIEKRLERIDKKLNRALGIKE